MKFCKKCNTDKPESQYSVDSRSKIGLQSSCKSCNIKYKKDNAAKLRAYQKQYIERNIDTLVLQRKEYRENNKDAIYARMAVWRKNNRDKILGHYYNNTEAYALSVRRRRATKLNADGTHTASDVREIFSSQKGVCANCKLKLYKSGENKYHVDHIYPLSKGGSNDKYNLQCLCPSCNLKKAAKHPLDWAKENERLL